MPIEKVFPVCLAKETNREVERKEGREKEGRNDDDGDEDDAG